MQRPGGLEAREGEASGGTPDPSGATVRVPGGAGQERVPSARAWGEMGAE